MTNLTAQETFAPVIAKLHGLGDNPVAKTLLAGLDHEVYPEPKGTMKAWMAAHHGNEVHTIQVDDHNGNVWTPLGRMVDASKASSVRLGESTRDYKGMRVMSASSDLLIVSDDWHTIAYIAK